MSNARGLRDLAGMVEALRAVPGMIERSLPQLAEALAVELRKTAAAGTSASGKPWAPRKSDGGQVMRGAAAAIEVRAVSGKNALVAEIGAPYAFHHYGSGMGSAAMGGGGKGARKKRSGKTGIKPRRPILPEAEGMPTRLGDAIRLGLFSEWDKTLASRTNYTKSGKRRYSR